MPDAPRPPATIDPYARMFGWTGTRQRRVPVVGVLPGEGIGPEVILAALAVLEAASAAGERFELRTGGDLSAGTDTAAGSAVADHVASFCEETFAAGGAVLCGPGGGRFVYDLRARFGLYCKLTPLQPFDALEDAGALRPEATRGVDILMVRENTGGAYFGEERVSRDSRGPGLVEHRIRYGREEVERILRVAVNAAGHRRGRLCLAVKPGGLPAMSSLWSGILASLASESPQVACEVLEVDNAAYQLIQRAGRFDVVVSPNMLGDILADLGALLLRSRGLSCSGNFGPDGRAVYQTGHGAAHDIAGTGQANPVGQILSVAMMVDASFGRPALAAAIRGAVGETLRRGWRTPDIRAPGCRVVGTRELGQRVAAALAARLERDALCP